MSPSIVISIIKIACKEQGFTILSIQYIRVYTHAKVTKKKRVGVPIFNKIRHCFSRSYARTFHALRKANVGNDMKVATIVLLTNSLF